MYLLKLCFENWNIEAVLNWDKVGWRMIDLIDIFFILRTKVSFQRAIKRNQILHLRINSILYSLCFDIVINTLFGRYHFIRSLLLYPFVIHLASSLFGLRQVINQQTHLTHGLLLIANNYCMKMDKLPMTREYIVFNWSINRLQIRFILAF